MRIIHLRSTVNKVTSEADPSGESTLHLTIKIKRG